jgi:NAD(P) transhydrogenase subunit beta
VVGGIIGAISFSGSLIAWAKLQGVINKTLRFGGQKFVNGLLFLGSLRSASSSSCITARTRCTCR